MLFVLVEMSFGFGMILGPTLGGAMYEAGGFSLPFAVLGGCLLFQVSNPSWYFLKSKILLLFSRFFPNVYCMLPCWRRGCFSDIHALVLFTHVNLGYHTLLQYRSGLNFHRIWLGNPRSGSDSKDPVDICSLGIGT
jgi:hypothetical protein